MKQQFSTAWKSSTQPRKQRKYAYNASQHIKTKMMGTNLSKELREKHKKRTMSLKNGDKVKVVRGQYKGKIGKIEEVIISSSRAYIEKIETIKKDGTKTRVPITVSNLMILELNMDDKKRIKKLERK